MNSPLTFGARLRQARERAGLDQQAVAQTLGISRVNLSYWENEKRAPGLRQLEQLGALYGTSIAALLGETQEDSQAAMPAEELDHLPPGARAVITGWQAFLDRWAEFLEEEHEALPGPFVSSLAEGRSAQPIVDTRRASGLALQLREHYRLGLNAIPDMTVLLARMGILVSRADLGREVSGAFVNHPRLGAAVLLNINSEHRRGRQQFTAAHELAHAQFHYQVSGVICRNDRKDAKERFADDFAAHFLVPRESLVEAVTHRPINDEYDLVWLQHEFNVSYAMLLIRLKDERLLSASDIRQYGNISPEAVARRLGLDTASCPEPSQPLPVLQTFPSQVINRIIEGLRSDVLSVASAARLLGVSQEAVAPLDGPAIPARREEKDELEQTPSLISKRPAGVPKGG